MCTVSLECTSVYICVVWLLYREELGSSLLSAQDEAGRREREWAEERERRDTQEQGLNQRVNQLQTSLSSTGREKTEVGWPTYCCVYIVHPGINVQNFERS